MENFSFWHWILIASVGIPLIILAWGRMDAHMKKYGYQFGIGGWLLFVVARESLINDLFGAANAPSIRVRAEFAEFSLF